MNKINKKLLIVICLLLVMGVGTTYALFGGWGSTNSAIAGNTLCFDINATSSGDLALDDMMAVASFDSSKAAYTNVTFSKKDGCTINGKGTLKATINTTANLSTGALKYRIYKGSGVVKSGTISSTGTSTIYSGFDIIDATKYDIYFWLDSSVIDNTYLEASFTGTIGTEAVSTGNETVIDDNTLYKEISNNSVMDNISSDYVTSSTGIDFSQNSSDTNGKGIYELSSSSNDDYPIYYYRGDVTDNNVLFAGFCWKIVRTTESGGIRLIYNGVASSGTCNNTGTSSQLSNTMYFNYNSNTSPVFVGYMYGSTDYTYSKVSIDSDYVFASNVTYNNGEYTLSGITQNVGASWNNQYNTINNTHYTCLSSSTTCTSVYYVYYTDSNDAYYITLSNGKTVEDAIEEMFSNNTTNSLVKGNNISDGSIDYWYYNNIESKGYSNYIEDSVYCNDRSIYDYAGWNANGGDTTTYLKFNAYNRIYTSYTPNLTCSNDDDKFSVSSANGNGDLLYSVGLVTADEVMLAGGSYLTANNSFYLYTGTSYLTMSPWSFDLSNGSIIAYVNGEGYLLNDSTYTSRGVRPTLSLVHDVVIESGDGSSSTPYVISSRNVTSLTTYSVTYDANGGSGAPSAQTKIYGENLVLSDVIPTNGIKIFVGWSTSSSATSATYLPGDTYSGNADLPLYAVWSSEDVTAPTITVTRTSYHTFTVSGTDTSGVYGYAVTTDNSEPVSWTSGSSGNVDIDDYTNSGDSNTYYVWFKDTLGNVGSKTITLYKVTSSVSDATLTITENNSSGDSFSGNYALYGTSLYLSAVADSGYSNLVIKVNDNIVSNNNAITVTGVTSIEVTASDSSAPSTPVVTRSDYNTFTYSATDNIGVVGYYVSTSSSVPSASSVGDSFALNSWTSVTSTSDLTLVAGTYYVWARDAAGNVSSTAGTINSYTITRSQGTGTTLVTRYDSTSSTSGTSWSSGSVIVLAGTSIYASASANSGFSDTTLKYGTISMNISGESFVVSSSLSIISSATDSEAPSACSSGGVTRTDYNTFKYCATDNVGVTGYYVSTTNSTPTLGSATSGFELSKWTTDTTTGNYTFTGDTTYYVYARDAAGNITLLGSIEALEITRSQGENTTLITRYDSTSSTTGTAWSSGSMVILRGTSIYASASTTAGYSVVLKHGSTTMSIGGSYYTPTVSETISSVATDSTAPSACSSGGVTRSDYNTFSYCATDSGSGVVGYYVSKNSTKPSAGSADDSFALNTWTSATSTGNLTLTSGTYYVYAMDDAGNVGSIGSIGTYTITKSQGTGTTLTIRYDSTDSDSGSELTSSSLIILAGTSIWAKATANSGFANPILKHGTTSMTASGEDYVPSASETISSSATDDEAPSACSSGGVTRTDYNTFKYCATDNVGVTGYYVSTSNTSPTLATATSSFALNTWTSATTTGNYSFSADTTYYVWARDAVGKTTMIGSIETFEITRSQGDNSTLVTRYDSTSSTTGTAWTSGSVVILDGTYIYASASASEGYSVTLKRGTTSMSISGSSFRPSESLTITSTAEDKTAPVACSSGGVTRDDYNTFSFCATDSGSGISGYYVSRSSTKPSASTVGSTFALTTWTSATSTGDLSLVSGTYYVYASDVAGNVSAIGSIDASKITRSVCSNVSNKLTLTTRYDSTSSTTGTEFSASSIVVLNGTNIYASASVLDDSELTNLTLSHGSTTMSVSGEYFSVSDDETISSCATDSVKPSTPTINRTDYNTFSYSATDNVSVSGYYVSTSSTAPSAGTVSSTFALNSWTSATSTGNLTLVAGTYYVWARDITGNVTESPATITAYTISTTKCSDASSFVTLSTRYDSTGESYGTSFTGNIIVLYGTKIWAKATLDSSHTGYDISLTRDSSNMTASGSYFTSNGEVTITACAVDSTKPLAPTISRTDYNTFSYSSTDSNGSGVSGYYISRTSSKPSAGTVSSTFDLNTWTSATSTGDLTLVAGTYYVWAMDNASNVSDSSTIIAYTIKRAICTGVNNKVTLTTRYDSTGSASGTEFTNNVIVLSGTSIYASAEALTNSYLTDVTLVHGSTSIAATGASFSATANETITACATDSSVPTTPTITRTDYNTFSYNSTDNIKIGGYYVSTSSTTPTAGDASSTFALNTWTTVKNTGDLTLIAGTYYVWAMDINGNISGLSSIDTYTISKLQGTNTTLSARYDSTGETEGTEFASEIIVLRGTNIWAKATTESEVYSATLSHGSTSMTASGSYFVAIASETIYSVATSAKYTITYDLGDADSTYTCGPSTYTYGTGATINCTPTSTSWTFSAWCTDSGLTSCNTTYTISTTDSGNKTYYAKWVDNIGPQGNVFYSVASDSKTVTVNVSAWDYASGLSSSYGYAIIDSDSTCSSSSSFTSSNNAIYTFTATSTNSYKACVKVTDTAGNVSYLTSGTFVLNVPTDFAYTGSSQTYTVPVTGYYNIKAWGASGGKGYSGSNIGTGGNGDYVSGKIYLTKGNTLYIYVGGSGNDVSMPSSRSSFTSTSSGGYNGGGDSKYIYYRPLFGSTNYKYGCGSGGGATDIRYADTSLYARIMVAGGGGGGNYATIGSSSYTFNGASANGLVGISGSSASGSNYSGGTRGSQTSGGGDFGEGGEPSSTLLNQAYNSGPGGGGGYYGGGAGQSAGGSASGSSFISGYAGSNAVSSSSSTTATNNTIHYSGKYFTNGAMSVGNNSGNGKVNISFVDTDTPTKSNTNLVGVRYIKDCINGSSANTSNHWVELQAIKDGSNIAKGLTGTLYDSSGNSISAGSSNSYSYVTDGIIDNGSYGSGSTSTGSQCFVIDLGATYDLDEIAVWHYWEDNRTYNSNITYTSSDNSTWNIVINKSAAETSQGKRVSAYESVSCKFSSPYTSTSLSSIANYTKYTDNVYYTLNCTSNSILNSVSADTIKNAITTSSGMSVSSVTKSTSTDYSVIYLVTVSFSTYGADLKLTLPANTITTTEGDGNILVNSPVTNAIYYDSSASKCTFSGLITGFDTGEESMQITNFYLNDQTSGEMKATTTAAISCSNCYNAKTSSYKVYLNSLSSFWNLCSVTWSSQGSHSCGESSGVHTFTVPSSTTVYEVRIYNANGDYFSKSCTNTITLYR